MTHSVPGTPRSSAAFEAPDPVFSTNNGQGRRTDLSWQRGSHWVLFGFGSQGRREKLQPHDRSVEGEPGFVTAGSLVVAGDHAAPGPNPWTGSTLKRRRWSTIHPSSTPTPTVTRSGAPLETLTACRAGQKWLQGPVPIHASAAPLSCRCSLGACAAEVAASSIPFSASYAT